MVYKASKTLLAIEEQIQADQGSSFRQWLGKVIPHMDDAYRANDSPFRTHLGASLIGGDCARHLFYSFRWAKASKFGGRLLRLFNRGHLEEARFIAMLLMIGCEVYQQDENGKQFRISELGGHFGGSGDGIAVGIPDLEPGTPALLEFKTSADKPFADLSKKGVKESKYEHYVQMQVYMRKMSLPVALYMVVNKNNDELYAEIVLFDPETADAYIDRGRNIVFLRTPPEKISESPSWWKCKFCDEIRICHFDEAPEINCRTCKFSEPWSDGTWHCTRDSHNPVIDKERQFKGCKKYKRLF